MTRIKYLINIYIYYIFINIYYYILYIIIILLYIIIYYIFMIIYTLYILYKFLYFIIEFKCLREIYIIRYIRIYHKIYSSIFCENIILFVYILCIRKDVFFLFSKQFFRYFPALFFGRVARSCLSSSNKDKRSCSLQGRRNVYENEWANVAGRRIASVMRAVSQH